MSLSTVEEVLTGKTEKHTVVWNAGVRVHEEVLEPLQEMKNQALKAGFEIHVCSGFRNFDRQVEIWNKKVLAKPEMSAEEKIFSILRWSALPGTSRHHWGTDLDIIDAIVLKPQMKVELIPEEFQPGGPFCKLHDWLDGNMDSFGFYRPYRTDRGGVSPERWHLSYYSIAESYLSLLTEDLIRKVIEESALLLKQEVLGLLPQIFSKHVRNIDPRDCLKV